MSRRKKSVKRPILPDARYDSQTVSKFINAIMYQGKKSTAERIFSRPAYIEALTPSEKVMRK